MITNRKFYKRIALFSISATIGILSYCVYLSIENINLQENFVSHSIGVLDGVILKRIAKCFAVHKETEKLVNDVFNKVRNEEMRVKDEYAVIKASKKLSPKQKQQEIVKIEEKWKNNSANYNKQINDIRLLDQKLTARINETLSAVLSEIAKKLNLFLIINKGTEFSLNVFYNIPSLDITTQVVNALDEKLANFSIKTVL